MQKGFIYSFMRKSVFIFYFMFCLFISKSQNLVPNGDFEYYSSCPTTASQISLASPWYDPNGATPDYYNACAPVSTFMNVPNQTLGLWQFAHSGVGYAGIWTRQAFGSNYREYVQSSFDSLGIGKCYAVTFYSNLSNLLKIGTNNLGAYISSNAVTSNQPNPINVTPQILLQGNPPIIDTLNWIKISGLYQAVGGEKFITIGNFNNDSTTTTQIVDNNSPWNGSYYYLDDVSIYEIKKSNAGRDTTICHGDSVPLGTANYEGVTYSWQPTTGLSNANIGKPMASPNITTTYYLTQTTPCAVTVDTVEVSVCDGVGVNENNKEDIVEVYPNPATSSLTLTLTKGEGVVALYNVLGECVLTTSIVNHKKEIDISFLPTGVYFVNVKSDTQSMNRKFIKE